MSIFAVFFLAAFTSILFVLLWHDFYQKEFNFTENPDDIPEALKDNKDVQKSFVSIAISCSMQ